MNSLASEQYDSRNDVPENPRSGDQLTADCGIIEMRLRELSQLFDAMDPLPLREKDLDRSAEEYIVDSVKELPSKTLYELVVHLDQPARVPDGGFSVGDSVRVHFARRSQLLRRKLRELIRRGLISLGIGLVFLAAVLIIAQSVGRLLGESDIATLLREGLLILGWVAMWRPLEIFLYDWWPIVGERRVHNRLSQIRVRIVYRDSQPTDTNDALRATSGGAVGPAS